MEENLHRLIGSTILFLMSMGSLNSSPSDTLRGSAVASAGDVNKDGYDDVIVGVDAGGPGGQKQVCLYLGGPQGLAALPAWTVQGDLHAEFGQSVAGAGDVNKDGYGDVIVGTKGYSKKHRNAGQVCLYWGGPDGLSAKPGWTAEGAQANLGFGQTVAAAGDVNKDGYDDILVGAPLYGKVRAREGKAYLYLGGPKGPASQPAWTFTGQQAGAGFGDALAGAGDVNADGYADVVVGAKGYDGKKPDEGKAFVFLGAAKGLAAAPAWTAVSQQASALFGDAVAGAGDVNRDGYGDVMVGAYVYKNQHGPAGRVAVYYGSAKGLSAQPSWAAEGEQALACFGQSVAGAGDLNGDGYSDVAIGAYLYQSGKNLEGRLYVYLGGEQGLASYPLWMADSDQSHTYFRYAVAGGGDINGDGLNEVLVSAPLDGARLGAPLRVYSGTWKGLTSMALPGNNTKILKGSPAVKTRKKQDALNRKFKVEVAEIQKSGGRAVRVILNGGANGGLKIGQRGVLLDRSGRPMAGLVIRQVDADLSLAELIGLSRAIETDATAALALP